MDNLGFNTLPFFVDLICKNGGSSFLILWDEEVLRRCVIRF